MRNQHGYPLPPAVPAKRRRYFKTVERPGLVSSEPPPLGQLSVVIELVKRGGETQGNS